MSWREDQTEFLLAEAPTGFEQLPHPLFTSKGNSFNRVRDPACVAEPITELIEQLYHPCCRKLTEGFGVVHRCLDQLRIALFIVTDQFLELLSRRNLFVV